LERLPDPSHGGGFLVHLTKKGLKVVDEAVEDLAKHSALAPAMAQLIPAEREQGIAFALKILRLLEENREGTL
jgi:DNA-binding MarR family transcriptional regulator